MTRGTIKLSGQELADIKKVLRVTKEDRHLGKLQHLFRKYDFQLLVSECQRRAMEKVGKKGETNAKKGKTPMLVPVDNILFHKGARHRSTVDELGEPLDENESDHDRMMRLSSYAKFKENKQLVNDARKMSKALADAIHLKDENFESLKRRNGENVRLKKQLEVTKEQLETTILEVSKVKGELDSALVEGEAFILAVDPNSDDDSDNEASISEDGPGNAEEGGDGDGVEMQRYIVRGSASDEDDSECPPFLHVL
ncbi:unnamed protein product [Malus baccata var. baccata]